MAPTPRRILLIDDDRTLGSQIAGYTYIFAIANNALQLTATAVPEPATYAAIFGALVLGLALYRKRQRR